MAKKIKYIDSHKASIFTKARLALTDAGKKIESLNTHCEIVLEDGQIAFRPISFFMEGTRTNKHGETTPIDLSNMRDGDLDFIKETLEKIGFEPEVRMLGQTGKFDVVIMLNNPENLNMFKRYGQMFEFNRFTMKFRRLDKRGVEALISNYTKMTR